MNTLKKYNIVQACVIFKLNQNTTKTLIKKYKSVEDKTIGQWEKELIKGNIKIEK